jgi:hypothetical protein
MNGWKKTLSAKLHLIILGVAFVITGGLFVACGGGGGGNGAGPAPTHQAGEIEAFGSIFVNGVEFHTGGADIIMDGVPVTGVPVPEDKLRVGMVVDVVGTVNPGGLTGTAVEVTFDDTIQGPVAGRNADGTFTVMGKPVVRVQDTQISHVNDTVGGARTFAEVLDGQQVEVSGGIDDQGRIVATHIELKAAGAESEITGKVESAGPPLVVAGIPVTADANTTFPNFPAGTTSPALGDLVEVKGSFAAGSLAATSIELKNGFENEANFHFEGFVQPGATAASFTLRGNHLDQTLAVTTTNATSFAGGARADLLPGTKVEAEGNLVGGILEATKVKFRENVRLQVFAGAQGADPSTVAIQDFSNVTVQTNVLTRVTPPGTAIAQGARLEIRGRKARDGAIIATRLDINNNPGGNTKVILRGPVESIVGNTVRLLGVDVDTAAVVAFRPNDDNSVGDFTTQTMTRGAFMAQVRVGTVIKARGVPAGDNVLAADEMELED